MSVLYDIFADFDGTLTDYDTIDYLVEHRLGRAYAHLMGHALLAGELTVRETLDQEFARLRMSPDEISRVLLERVRVDPDLPGLAALARRRGHRFVIVSSGMDLLIEPLLRLAGCAPPGQLELCCNRLHWDARAGCLHIEYRDDSDNGHHKLAHLEAARARGRRVLFMGDGVTDYECAGAADVLFARGHLADHCRRNGIPFHAFHGCRDVVRFLGSPDADFATVPDSVSSYQDVP